MTLGNAFFWLSYGFGVMDYAIFVPNACGLILGLIQLVFCFIFPRTDCDAESSVEVDGGELLADNNLEIL